jgi:hypothetical protein
MEDFEGPLKKASAKISETGFLSIPVISSISTLP